MPPGHKEDPRFKLKPMWGILLSIGVTLFFLAGLELTARVLVDDSELDEILDVLQQDPVLFWRNRCNLDTFFAGAPITTNGSGFRVAGPSFRKTEPKKKGRFRIVCMGGSETFGWGVTYEQTYCHGLQSLLNKTASVDVETINAGMIGFSSHQGRLLLQREVVSLEPDLITVSYVLNDIDKYRFYRSNGEPDRKTPPQNAVLIALSNLVDRSRFARLYGKGIQYLAGGRTSFEGRPVEVYRPQSRRVPPEDYRSNLEAILDAARARGIGVVLVKFPVNLPEPEERSASQIQAGLQSYQEGKQHLEASDYARAIQAFRKAVEHDPYLSEAHYSLGLCYRQMGDKLQAEKAFSDTMESEAYRCGKDGKTYNQIMASVAEGLGVPLVDVVEVFGKVTDRYLFVSRETDPIHPNADGHRLMAQALNGTLIRLLPTQ